MKDKIMQNIIAVLGALNNITVSGKQNLANLSGSISVLEEIAGILEGADVVIPGSKADEDSDQ